MTLPSLSVVMPVYDEQQHLRESLGRLRRAVDVSPWRGSEIVVVNDGSTDGSGDVLHALEAELGLRVVDQQNQGRLGARSAGLSVATGDLVLLVDARVHVDHGSLSAVAREMDRDPDAVLWNGDVTVATAGNVFAGFWAALTTLGWRRYFKDRRRTSFGPEEFDLFPKGTGLFLGPRSWLIEESARLETRYEDRRFASDDTALLRALCARSRIHLSPEFSCTYYGRQTARAFLDHAFFRGTTFVDGYIGRSGQVGRVFSALLVATPIAVAAAARRPGRAAWVAATGCGAVGVAARRSGASRHDAAALVVLLPVFAAPFATGVLRGLLLAGQSSLRRRRQPT